MDRSSAAQGQLGPDFHQRDEDNIDASREQAAAQRRRLVKFSRVGKARTCQLHLGRLDVSFVWWSSRV